MQATNHILSIDTTACAANSACFLQPQLREQLLSLQGDVLRFCTHYLKDTDKGLEASQEVMFKALKNLVQFEHRASLKTWVMKIAFNVCSTEYRKMQHNTQLFTEFDESDVSIVGECYDNNSSGEDEPNPRLAQIVSSLSETQQAILRYKFVDDMSLVEIASIMNAKQSSVKMNYYRALEKIHKLYVS